MTQTKSPSQKTAPKIGLGRGFDSLLPQNFDDSVLFSKEDKIEQAAVGTLTPNAYQPRQEFDAQALQELADSIREYGVLQPLIVVPYDGQAGHSQGGAGQAGAGAAAGSAGAKVRYMIIAGERRWRAARLAGLKTVPVIIRTLKDLQRLEVALIENVQRVDLSPLEQAESIEYLHQQFGTAYKDIAKRLGKAHSTVANIARLMQLPDEAKQALRAGKITEGHARAVLALKGNPDKQTALLQHIINHGWTVRQAEQFVVSLREGHQEPKQTKQRMQSETPATRRLAKRLNTAVAIRRTAKGGKLEVSFTSDEQLEQILGLLG